MLLRLDDRGGPALLLRATGGPAHWQPVDAAQLRARAGRRPLSVLVPGEDVLLTRARLAPMGSRRRRRAIPFVLEEDLADEVERLHFTPGAAGEDPLPVAVVASARLAHWQTMLADAAVRARLITPDVLAVPWSAASWTVLLDGDRAWVRQGPQCGFATERATLAVWLDAAIAGAAGDLPVQAQLYAAPDDVTAPQIAARLQAHGIAVVQHRDREQALDWLGSGLDPRAAINLLLGDHGAATQAAPPRRAWLRGAALLASLSVVYLGIVSVQHQRAKARLDVVDARIAALYREIYPGEQLPAQPRERMARDLAALARGDASHRDRLLAVLAPAARRLGEAPGWELQRLDFRDGRLDLDVRMPDAAALDRVQHALSRDAALAVERVSASATQGAAEARFRLRLAGGAQP